MIYLGYYVLNDYLGQAKLIYVSFILCRLPLLNLRKRRICLNRFVKIRHVQQWSVCSLHFLQQDVKIQHLKSL